MQQRLVSPQQFGTLAGLVLILLGGCSNAQPVGVSGRVTLQKKPLDEAVIQFVPVGTKGKINGSEIHKGEYTIDATRGLLPGKYRVDIKDNPPLELAHKPGALAQRRTLPEKYASDSKLEIEIPAGAMEPLTFNFDLN
jgi:hypothetical protein